MGKMAIKVEVRGTPAWKNLERRPKSCESTATAGRDLSQPAVAVANTELVGAG
jgi:hypothetical protein